MVVSLIVAASGAVVSTPALVLCDVRVNGSNSLEWHGKTYLLVSHALNTRVGYAWPMALNPQRRAAEH